jgi:hypothetical protein
MSVVTFQGTLAASESLGFRSRRTAPRKHRKRGMMMQDSAARKMSQATAMIVFALLSIFSAAATAVVPLLIHA